MRYVLAIATNSLLLLQVTLPVSAQGADAELEILIREVERLDSTHQYDSAFIVAEKALEVAEHNVGPDHPNMATSLNRLAEIDICCDHARAELMYKRVVKIQEKALGPNHPDTVPSLNRLADMYRYQVKYALAELTYKRVVKIQEKALGPDHPDIVPSLNRLAELYQVQGLHVLAELLHERSLGILENTPEPDNWRLKSTLLDLADVYEARGRNDEANLLRERAGVRSKYLVIRLLQSLSDLLASVHPLIILLVGVTAYRVARSLVAGKTMSAAMAEFAVFPREFARGFMKGAGLAKPPPLPKSTRPPPLHGKHADEPRSKPEEERSTHRHTTSGAENDERYYGNVLGLSGDITRDDLRRRYRELAAKYHPDKVHHMGDKIKETAEREMKKINEAYEYFRKEYGM